MTSSNTWTRPTTSSNEPARSGPLHSVLQHLLGPRPVRIRFHLCRQDQCPRRRIAETLAGNVFFRVGGNPVDAQIRTPIFLLLAQADPNPALECSVDRQPAHQGN